MPDPGTPSGGGGSGSEDAPEFRSDWREAESLPAVIVRTIAALDDVPITAVDPLYDHVDPDALDALFGPSAGGSARATGHVRFAVHGYEVVVHADGELVVTPSDAGGTGDAA